MLTGYAKFTPIRVRGRTTRDDIPCSPWRFQECECTKVEQDETCPVGYPSLLCEVCDGKGVVKIYR